MFAPLAALCLLGGSEGLAILAWPCFALLGLLAQRPLFDHHMVALIPALTTAIGVGTAYLGVVYDLSFDGSPPRFAYSNHHRNR
jgi:hypothetical protein